MRATAKPLADTNTAPEKRSEIATKLTAMTNRFTELDGKLSSLTTDKPAAKKAVIHREKVLAKLGNQCTKQKPAEPGVKTPGKDKQVWAETCGGGAG